MPPTPSLGARVATGLGFVLLALVGMLYLVSGLVVPVPWVAAVWAVWLAISAYAIKNRRRPGIVLAAPVLAVVLWVAIVTAGEVLFDWSA